MDVLGFGISAGSLAGLTRHRSPHSFKRIEPCNPIGLQGSMAFDGLMRALRTFPEGTLFNQ
jgi:hypothetical protein